MKMIRKGQVRWLLNDDIAGPAAFVGRLFGMTAAGSLDQLRPFTPLPGTYAAQPPCPSRKSSAPATTSPATGDQDLALSTHPDSDFVARPADVSYTHRNGATRGDAGGDAHVDLAYPRMSRSIPKPQHLGHPAAD